MNREVASVRKIRQTTGRSLPLGTPCATLRGAAHEQSNGARQVDHQDNQPMSSATLLPAGTEPMFAQVRAINQAALDGGDYETACHALQAALARAYFLQDEAQVTAVQQRAAVQQTLTLTPQESQTPPSKVHPARWNAILLVYGTIAQEAASLLDLLRLHA